MKPSLHLEVPESFIANLKSQYVTPVITRIQNSTEALETRTANRLANEALGAIREAASDANVTEAEITALWTAALPLIQDWYQELLDDANTIENEGERSEAIAALGSPEQFIANLKSQYVTPVIAGIQRGRETLETRTANRLANEALGAIRTAAEDANVTEAEIVNLWTTALPLIEDWYQELLQDAQAIENEGDRTEAIAALGSPEQFVANLKSQYVTPVIMGIRRSAEALETRTANRLANNALQGIREAASDVNVTEAEITRLWTEALPLIETWYQELLDDAEAIENEGERDEAIAALGTPEQFVANLKSQYVTPVLNGISQSTEALETRTANRQAQTAIQALRDVAGDVNVTEQAIRDKWQEAIPFIRTWWQELHDDIENNENLSESQIAESLAELGSVEAFVGNIRSQYVTPVLNNILQTRFQNRSNLAQNRLNRAQFNLGFATSESDFERRRGLVVDAINAYYDAEEERINNLEASEEELKNLRQDNDDARRQALAGIISEENQYLEIKREQAEALVELEEKTQEKITDIQRKAIQDREDVQQDFSRDLEDILRDAGAAETLFTSGDFQRIQTLAQIPDTSALEERLSGLGIDLSEGQLDEIRELARQRRRDQEDIGNRERRSIAEQERIQQETLIGINRHAVETQTRLTTEITTLTTEITALTTALIGMDTPDTAISTDMPPLSESDNTFTESDSEVAVSDDTGVVSSLADFVAMQKTLQAAEAANIENFGAAVSGFFEIFVDFPDLSASLSGIPETLGEITGGLQGVADGLGPVVADLTSVEFSSLEILPSSLDRLSSAIEVLPSEISSALSTLFSRGYNHSSRSRSSDEQTPIQVNVEVRNPDVMLDGEKVGQMMGDTVVKQNAQGRNLLGG